MYEDRPLPALALVAPAVRMVVVAVFAHRDDEGDIVNEPPVICPVLAIRSCFIEEQDDQLDSDLLVWCDRNGRYGPSLCTPDEMFGSFRPGTTAAWSWEAAPCPWPHDEDERRLAALVEELSHEAMAIVANRIIANHPPATRA